MRRLNTEFYVITDSTGMTEEMFFARTEAALRGGATILQLREKERTDREYLAMAEKVHGLTQRYGVPLVIDDRVDIALASGAEGVHLGESDLPIARARELCGEKILIGATAKTVLRAREAWHEGADYLGVGAIFPTMTKVKTKRTSVETLKNICRAVPIPVNAIGGLNSGNLAVLKGCGVAGICVISAVMRAADPEAEARVLRERVKELIQK